MLFAQQAFAQRRFCIEKTFWFIVREEIAAPKPDPGAKAKKIVWSTFEKEFYKENL